MSAADTEWVPTSKDYARNRSFRGYHSPFYSFTVRTLGLLLDYSDYSDVTMEPSHDRYAMIIDIAALLSVIPTDVRNVPWVDWGPSSTHLFDASWLMPAGPFWITDCPPPLVVRQYDLLRMWYTRSPEVNASSSQTRPLVFPSTKESCSCWEAGKVTTNLPYRAYHKGFRVRGYDRMMADREWFVFLSESLLSVCGFCAHMNHSRGSLIVRAGRERKIL
jgi:hypothetical protein